MTEPSDLSDSELLSRSHAWRRQAVRGTPNARIYARACEAEVRRRFSGFTTLQAPLDMRPTRQARRPFWRLF